MIQQQTLFKFTPAGEKKNPKKRIQAHLKKYDPLKTAHPL